MPVLDHLHRLVSQVSIWSNYVANVPETNAASVAIQADTEQMFWLRWFDLDRNGKPASRAKHNEDMK